MRADSPARVMPIWRVIVSLEEGVREMLQPCAARVDVSICS